MARLRLQKPMMYGLYPKLAFFASKPEDFVARKSRLSAAFSLLFAVAFDGTGGKFRGSLAAERVDIGAETLIPNIHPTE